MAYAQGGLIQATDYNNLLNGTNQLNTVWGVGTGDAGYGQTTQGTVAAGGTVSATQWAGLINNLNSTRLHQTGSNSGITAVTAGQTVNYLSTLQTQVNSAYTARASYASQGATTTGTTFTFAVSSTTGGTIFQDRFVTFASADQARYFFNAGGQLNFRISVTGGTGSAANNSYTNLINAVGGVNLFNNSNSGRTGTGLTLTTNNTTIGYRQMTTGAPLYIQVNDTATAYTANYSGISIYTNATGGGNGANGSLVGFRCWTVLTDHPFDDTITCTLNTRVDIVFPETTYLTNVWGTPTIT